MAADMLVDLFDKRTAPYVIWTLVFLACAIFFWLSRSPQESGSASSLASSCGAGRDSTGRRRRTVSIGLDGTLLGVAAGAMEEVAVTPLLELCSTADVFTVALAENDSREAEIHRALESVGAFGAGLKRHRVMFSATPEGRASMVRQLQPAVHLEAVKAVADALAGKVPEVRLVGSPEWPTFTDAACLGGSAS
mmetsp:Transcript_116482/g.324605  ORF Transcript_116482/g.324605 Transcript_116482/m.324605 type:complete len:193 (+) Transcript_116482:88-666(+)